MDGTQSMTASMGLEGLDEQSSYPTTAPCRIDDEIVDVEVGTTSERPVVADAREGHEFPFHVDPDEVVAQPGCPPVRSESPAEIAAGEFRSQVSEENVGFFESLVPDLDESWSLGSAPTAQRAGGGVRLAHGAGFGRQGACMDYMSAGG